MIVMPIRARFPRLSVEIVSSLARYYITLLTKGL